MAEEEKRIQVDFENVWRELARMEGSAKEIAEYAYRQGRNAGKAQEMRANESARKSE